MERAPRGAPRGGGGPVKGYRAKVSAMAAMAAGRKRLDKGDLKGALASFGRATLIDPLCAQAFLYRAGLRLLAKDFEGALADFRTMGSIDHSHLPAYRDLTTLSAEEFPELIPSCERVLRADPSCAWAHVFHAFSLRSLMRYDDAVADLDRAVALAPESASLLAMRSRVKLTNRQDFYDGVRDMEAALALEPRWGWLHCWLGEALRHQGRFAEAERALSRGLALDPRYLRGYAWRGGARNALGKHRLALKDLDASLAYDPIYHYDFEYTADQKSWAHNQKLTAYRALGDVPRALGELNKAHALGPRYMWCFNPKSEPAVWDAAIEELDRELARSPRSAWARAWRGWTEQQRGNLERALDDFDAALRLSPRLAWPSAWKGRVLWHLGRPAEALPCLDRALARDPDYAPAWGWRGDALKAVGKFREAERDFTRAIALDHRAAWAFAGRGDCRRRLGRDAEAAGDLDRALAICPDYQEAERWREELRRGG